MKIMSHAVIQWAQLPLVVMRVGQHNFRKKKKGTKIEIVCHLLLVKKNRDDYVDYCDKFLMPYSLFRPP